MFSILVKSKTTGLTEGSSVNDILSLKKEIVSSLVLKIVVLRPGLNG